MLAMLCSKPDEMKAKRHQKIKMSLADSLLALCEVQMARQTSQLQRIPRKNSS
ncbi:hypothetical protein D3C73_1649380 [compost metagenome]